MSEPYLLRETQINVIAEGSRLEGKVLLDKISRVHGTVVGEIQAAEGSLLVLAESAVVEGKVQGDRICVDGYVRGDIVANVKVSVSRTGRVVGNIRAPAIEIDFGAHFEGNALAGKLGPEKLAATKA